MDVKLLDLKDSKLILEGTKQTRDEWAGRIANYKQLLQVDQSERKNIYAKRHDFYTGNHSDYSNITGVIKDIKNKKGHVNQVTNYAGKTCVKIAYGLANNPPKITIPPLDVTDSIETARAQAVQDFIDDTLNDYQNRFWKKTYRRSVFNQVEFGDAGFRSYVKDGKIRICGHDDMGSLLVGWNGEDPSAFDFVIAEMLITPQRVMDEYGIKVNEKALPEQRLSEGSSGSWDHNNQWGNKTTSQNSPTSPTGKTMLPKVKVTEFDSRDVYIIEIEGEIVQYIEKDDVKYPKALYWTLVHNIPNPPSSWSIADIDYLMDGQIELNDNDNRTADYLRVGSVQRYVAYNMTDFDPESIKTSSGQVIFVNDPDGRSKFEPLQTNINNFPADQYAARKLQHIYDMGLPKVNYGSSGADSGRSKVIDYQSSIDLVVFKRDAWELALQDLIEKIQILGHYLYPDEEWFLDVNGDFVIRQAEFDWTDILPTTASDKIVNVANKFNMIGIPFEQAYKELGYRNPAAMVETLKKELESPELMTLRSKMWQLSEGILTAQNQAAVMAQSNMNEVAPPGTAQPTGGEPMLTPELNSSSASPMASPGTTRSSAGGNLNRVQQNLQAKQ